MDEDTEIGQEDDEGDPPRPRSAIADFVAVLIAAVILYIGVAKTTGVLLLLVLSVGIPATLLWFVWHVFLRKMWRVRRIRGAQERRDLMEAAMRDRKEKS